MKTVHHEPEPDKRTEGDVVINVVDHIPRQEPNSPEEGAEIKSAAESNMIQMETPASTTTLCTKVPANYRKGEAPTVVVFASMDIREKAKNKIGMDTRRVRTVSLSNPAEDQGPVKNSRTHAPGRKRLSSMSKIVVTQKQSMNKWLANQDLALTRGMGKTQENREGHWGVKRSLQPGRPGLREQRMGVQELPKLDNRQLGSPVKQPESR